MGLREAVSFSVSVPFASAFILNFFNVVSLIHCFYGFLLCIQQLRLLQVLSAKSRFTCWKVKLGHFGVGESLLWSDTQRVFRAAHNIRIISWLFFGSPVSHSKALSHT